MTFYAQAQPRDPDASLRQDGERVSILGLGGFHLGLPRTDAAAVRLTHAAIAAGVTFMDNAWDYNDGLSETRMGKAIADRRDQVFLMTKVCTHGRDGKVAMRQLEQSLKRLRTDHLDLWQVHELAFDDEPEKHFARGGVVEAMERARKQGKVRYLGFTGHKSPALHLTMLDYDFDWDACQLPLNCFDGSFRSFETIVLPELIRRGIAPIGMKSLCGDGRAVIGRDCLGRESAVVRAQPAGGDGRQRDGVDEGAGAERRRRARVPADDGGSARRCAQGWRSTPRTAAGSCTRSRRRSKGPRRAASTGCRRRVSCRRTRCGPGVRVCG